MHGRTDPLAPLLADGVIDEVVARLKSGKEADLWIVRHRGEAIAAKVYKARHVRSFKNDAGYREGRQVRDTRTQRAMDRGSRFGQAAAEEAWKTKEADALHALHAAGVRVPRPVMFYEGVLLMELVLDGHGHPAPRLVDAHVGREQARVLYEDLRGQAVRMLCSDLIHGDLSPYNVLVGAHGPVVIDFPQVVGAAHNSQAESYFRRDLENLRRFFAHLDPALHAASGDAREIWRAYVRRELSPDFVPSGREPAPPPRREHGHAQHGGKPVHPDHGRSERPRHERPREEHPRHGHGRPEHGRPEHGRPEHGRPDHGRPEHGRPDHGRPEHGRPEHGRPDHGRPDQPRPEHGRQGQRPAHGERGDAARRAGERGPQRGPRPQGRPDERRRGGPPARDAGRPRPPAPEVIRVVRPPLAAPAKPGAAGAPPQAPPGAPHGSPRAGPNPPGGPPGGPHPHHRRRRRR